MNVLKIGAPRIEAMENGRVRLCAKFVSPQGEYDCWYEVAEEYGKYLCYEVSDAFVVGTLPLAMKMGWDIELEGAISEKLHYQLVNYYIPVVSRYADNNEYIHIAGKTTNIKFESAHAVGAGMSGGVDSFYTVLKHYGSEHGSYAITHLTYFNVGAHGNGGGPDARKAFLEGLKVAEVTAKALNLPVVWVDSNLSEFVQMSHAATCTCRTLSAVLALQKLFSIYYLSSAGYSAQDFNINDDDCADYDIFGVPNLSTENTTFHIYGMEARRLDKERYLAEQPVTWEYLNVCFRQTNARGCGKCEKCMRTTVGLYAMGKLENYSKIFDLDDFKKTLPKKIGYVLSHRSKSHYEDIYRELKKNKIKIPLMAHFYSAVEREKNVVRPLYNKSSFLQRLRQKL